MKRLCKIFMMFILVLSFFSVNSSTEAAKVSYLRDTNKIYVYKDYLNNVTYSIKYIGIGKEKDWQGFRLWEMDGDYKGEIGAVEKETTSGLYDGEYKILAYPIKSGKKWKDNFGHSYEIISTNKTIKTPAGTFKNVIAVKDEYEISYYAKGVGLIRLDNGEKMKKKYKNYYELVKLKKK